MTNAYVYVDGNYMGVTKDPESIVENIRTKRRNGEVSDQINIGYHPHLEEVKITTDAGRVRRPLIIVEKGKSKFMDDVFKELKSGKIVWEDLVKKGIIEYLDSEEEENAFIALKPDNLTAEHTHVEVDPAVILGFSASFVPYAEFNRGDRVNFGAKMIGQSIGLFASNYLNRTDTKSNVMCYPQEPLVQTHAHKIINYSGHPNGMNLIIAIGGYEGYNMEDAVIINKGSLERGVLWSYLYRTYNAEQKRYLGGQEDIMGIPQAGVKGYVGEDSYKHLDEDGIINPEEKVVAEKVLVGRMSPLRFLGTMDQFITGVENIRETSVKIRCGDKGIVDRVLLSETTNGTKIAKVIMRDLKVPEIGDKLASRHGQKGVIGLIVPEEDMPFTEEGIVPDIIFNPHGIPSRMTMGKLLEIIAAKVAALSGEKIYSSIFSQAPEKELRTRLAEHGYQDDGKEDMYDGKCGEKLKSSVLIGSIFYQKLDHLVSNKIHARSRGPVTLLTKQPTEGRSKEGGLRLGEMEKDCLIAHGAALTLKERFDSDKTLIPICTECGTVAVIDRVRNKNFCPIDGNSKIKEIEMSYAFKLMLDELKSMIIYPKLIMKEE